MRNLITVAMLLAVLMTACEFPFTPGSGVVFKVQLIASGDQVGETKLIEIGTTEKFVAVGGANDVWGRTWAATEFKNNKEFRLYFEVDSNDEKFRYCLIDVVQMRIHTSDGATGWLSPSGYDAYFCNWQGCDAAEYEDGCYAIVDSHGPSEQEFYDFNFSIPGDAVILGIAVRVKGKAVGEDGVMEYWSCGVVE